MVGTGRIEGVTGIGTASAVMENATGKVVISAGGLWTIPDIARSIDRKVAARSMKSERPSTIS
jgi:hypothetical protein